MISRLFTILIMVIALAATADRFWPITALWEPASGDWASGCPIKGNISQSGERIYHVPGGEWYDATQIDRTYGERWFCSEQEARAAGWRRSYR